MKTVTNNRVMNKNIELTEKLKKAVLATKMAKEEAPIQKMYEDVFVNANKSPNSPERVIIKRISAEFNKLKK